jgi:hypothetical protein
MLWVGLVIGLAVIWCGFVIDSNEVPKGFFSRDVNSAGWVYYHINHCEDQCC